MANLEKTHRWILTREGLRPWKNFNITPTENLLSFGNRPWENSTLRKTFLTLTFPPEHRKFPQIPHWRGAATALHSFTGHTDTLLCKSAADWRLHATHFLVRSWYFYIVHSCHFWKLLFLVLPTIIIVHFPSQGNLMSHLLGQMSIIAKCFDFRRK